jgi:hypothetical protein
MRVSIILKNGQKYEFQDADIQKKDNGKFTAVYNTSTYRILAEYKADQILMCQRSRNDVVVRRAVF